MVKNIILQDPNVYEPDYELWWNQEDLSEIEIYLIIKGINPDLYFRYKKINSSDYLEWTDEESSFRQRYKGKLSDPEDIDNDIVF